MDKLIPHKRLLEVLRYDPDTGEWQWLERKRGRPVNRRAGCLDKKFNRWRINVDQRIYTASRLAFFYMTGRWPDKVDHIDRCQWNDKWSNLREATTAQNAVNSPARSKCGLKGVSFHAGRWRASTYYKGKPVYLGRYDTPEEAHAAWYEFTKKHHGEFADTVPPKRYSD